MDPELKLKIQRRVVRNFFHSEKTTNLAHPWKGNKFFGMELVEIRPCACCRSRSFREPIPNDAAREQRYLSLHRKRDVYLCIPEFLGATLVAHLPNQGNAIGQKCMGDMLKCCCPVKFIGNRSGNHIQ